MPDILQDFPIKAPRNPVYQAVSTPVGLDSWWTKKSCGTPVEGAEYKLWFGPQHDWRAIVTRSVQETDFEMRMVVAVHGRSSTCLRRCFGKQGIRPQRPPLCGR